jgi:hypothetical protein
MYNVGQAWTHDSSMTVLRGFTRGCTVWPFSALKLELGLGRVAGLREGVSRESSTAGIRLASHSVCHEWVEEDSRRRCGLFPRAGGSGLAGRDGGHGGRLGERARMDALCGRCLSDGFPQSPGGGRGAQHYEKRRRGDGRSRGRG